MRLNRSVATVMKACWLRLPWLLVGIQILGVLRVLTTYQHENAHVPEGFIELHILLSFSIVLALVSLPMARRLSSAAWWLLRGLAIVIVLWLAAAYLSS